MQIFIGTEQEGEGKPVAAEHIHFLGPRKKEFFTVIYQWE